MTTVQMGVYALVIAGCIMCGVDAYRKGKTQWVWVFVLAITVNAGLLAVAVVVKS